MVNSSQSRQAAFGFAELAEGEQAMGKVCGFDFLARPIYVGLHKRDQPLWVAYETVTRYVVFDIHLSQNTVVGYGRLRILRIVADHRFSFQ
jgi:hypothetical protein